MAGAPSTEGDEPLFSVRPYSIQNLIDLFADIAGATVDAVAGKTHLVFFEGYFQDASIGAKTIVVEAEYVDHDYLEDFAAYYVRCFEDYDRKCVRMHFFNHPFSETDFRALLSGDESKLSVEQLQRSYLGFIVTKPFPHAFVGRTCLKTYGDDGGRRRYLNVRPCTASLFGIELEVDSLAFQEQDRVVSACATSALWSAFHATSALFQHSLPSPVDITRQAAEHSPVRSRVFPHSDGLLVEQMAFAIRRVGLEPLYIQGDPEDPEEPGDVRVTARVLRSSVHAYSSFGIPLILLTGLIGPDGKHIGSHACTITGFSVGATLNLTDPRTVLSSDRIDKLYVHDDQVGPFARMELIEQTGLVGLTTSWGLPGLRGVIAVPFALLVPLYNKIRIPFSNAIKLIKALDRGLSLLRGAPGNPLQLQQERLEWDVRLTSINEFKASIVTASHLTQEQKVSIRLLPMPRFLWRATASTSAGVMMDVLIDATDINHGRFIRYFHVSENSLHAALEELQHVSPQQLQGSGAPQQVVAIFLGLLGFLDRLNEPLSPR
ncbi:MAG: hypothetical protein IT461_16610 [Planctomycetes bacterium]|nr:hypothetical protein [Planctomycetota bacterium]